MLDFSTGMIWFIISPNWQQFQERSPGQSTCDMTQPLVVHGQAWEVGLSCPMLWCHPWYSVSSLPTVIYFAGILVILWTRTHTHTGAMSFFPPRKWMCFRFDTPIPVSGPCIKKTADHRLKCQRREVKQQQVCYRWGFPSDKGKLISSDQDIRTYLRFKIYCVIYFAFP